MKPGYHYLLNYIRGYKKHSEMVLSYAFKVKVSISVIQLM